MVPDDDCPQNEIDYFHDALPSIFNEVEVSHGNPGSTFTYNSNHGPISVRLLCPAYDDIQYFSHYVWNSGLLICNLFAGLANGKKCLELGAGVALPSFISAMDGAIMVRNDPLITGFSSKHYESWYFPFNYSL